MRKLDNNVNVSPVTLDVVVGPRTWEWGIIPVHPSPSSTLEDKLLTRVRSGVVLRLRLTEEFPFFITERHASCKDFLAQWFPVPTV